MLGNMKAASYFLDPLLGGPHAVIQILLYLLYQYYYCSITIVMIGTITISVTIIIVKFQLLLFLELHYYFFRVEDDALTLCICQYCLKEAGNGSRASPHW